MTPNDKKKSRTFHDGDGLFIPNRQLSLLASGALTLVFFVFLGGYFLGKNTMVEPFMMRVEQTAFADQIYSSLCARYDQSNDDGDQTMKNSPETIAVQSIEDQGNKAVSLVAQAALPETMTIDAAGKQSWYAPLIGYGKEQSAVVFADKLHQKGISVNVKKYASKTPKGKVRHWYQVVTEPHNDRTTLQAIVDKIAQEEKIKNIKIIEIA